MQAEKEGVILCENIAGADFKFQEKKIKMPFENYDSDTFEIN